MMMKEDVYGDGLKAYINGDKKAVFVVESDIAETEEWPISTFFRDYKEMPKAERLALQRCSGSVLDVGAGAGSHSLYLQQHGGNVTALDISEGAVEVMQQRGIEKTILADFFQYSGATYDTILMLMNGVGIVGKLNNLSSFFIQAKKLLNPGGKILLDSSDLIYLFEEEDGSVMIDLNGSYYGELEYTFEFNGKKGNPFNWVFVDYEKLEECAKLHGFSCKKVYEDDHYLYLAEIKLL
ncbi:MAG: class I SAM-dependent methyltransferase [Paludibacteraceae bacterium]|nr:class I SAM-dependent methyltransferase [Paludibacteraceae bacterium]